jgi:hypothetical protein
MIKRMLLVAVVAGAVVGGAIVAGCDDPKVPAPAPRAALPAGLVLSSAPAGAKTIKEVRAGAKDGDEVVMRGVIAGRVDPIGDNRAILTLLDPSIKTCDKMPEGCKTPWDACCEDKEVITANSATVQVVDEKGAVLKTGLASVPGIKPLKEVVVKGKLKVSPDGKAVVVDASRLYVAP